MQGINPQKVAKLSRLWTDARSLWEKLMPEDRKIFAEEIYLQLHEEDFPVTLEEIYSMDYATLPVHIRQFVADKYYLGGVLEDGLYPKLLDDLEEIFSGDYDEVVLGGGIGWGKTRMMEVGMIYELYCVSCLRDPAKSYGLIQGSTLAFLNVSVTETQATKVFFKGMFDLIKNSPYFKEKFPYEKRLKSEARFPKNLVCYPVASNETSMLGEGVFAAAFDEINFMPIIEHSTRSFDIGPYDHAVALYNRLRKRIRSRMNQRGRLPGHIWIASSARYPNDFTERKESESRYDKSIFYRRYATWETAPSSKFLSERFRVEVGSLTQRSRILEGNERDVDASRVIEVPLDYKPEFERNVDEAVRDIAGRAVLSIRPFMPRPDKVIKMFEHGEKAGLRHPFTKLDVTLQDPTDQLIPENLQYVQMPVTDDNGHQLYSDRGVRLFNLKMHHGPYFSHNDGAKTRDAWGHCICHIVGEKTIPRSAGDPMPERVPIIRVDLLLRIVAPRGGEIEPANIRGIYYQLAQLGMHFKSITYDSFGSLESIQILKRDGYNADEYSLDKTPEGYNILRQTIYDEAILCYNVPRLQQELLTIEFDEKKQKVDHPPHGSKDLADALAGAVAGATKWFYEQIAPSSMLPQTQKVTEDKLIPGTMDIQEYDDPWEKIERGEPLTDEDWSRLT